jgi:SAM-dependent methyltransferase
MASPYSAEFYENQRERSLASARVVAPIVYELCRPRSVLDVGCGLGTWLRAFLEIGVQDVLGLDGDYVQTQRMQIPVEVFQPTDLVRPFNVNRVFDLAISLEVAEHLPPGTAKNFIASLTRTAPVILFSAAIPYQGGTEHRNEQWPSYWAKLFLESGHLAIDCLRSKIWGHPDVQGCYGQNIILYARQEFIDQNPALGEWVRRPADVLPLVHPETYLKHADPRRDSLRKWFPRGLRALRNSLAAKLSRPPVRS